MLFPLQNAKIRTAVGKMPKGIISNIKRYLTSVYSDFDSKWFIFFSSHIVCICCIIGVAV